MLDLVDWVGLDIKATPAKYAAITGVANSTDPASRSLRLLLDAGVPVQVRTTVDPTVLDAADLAEITASLRAQGVTDHLLQEVRTEGANEAFVERLVAHRREH